MPIEVSIPQIGDVSFPDDMSMDDINETIRTKILPQYVEQKKADISQAQSQAEQLMKYGGFQKFIEPLERPFVSLPTAPDVEQTGLVGPEKLFKYNVMSLSGAVSPETQASIARGTYNVGKQFAEFVASPIGVATVAASTIPVLRPAIAAIFGAKMLKEFPEAYEDTVNILANPESTTQQKTEALLGYLSQGTLGVKLGAKGAAGMTKQLVNAAGNFPEGALKATIRAKTLRPLPSRRKLAALTPAGVQQPLPPAMGPLGIKPANVPKPAGPISPIFAPDPIAAPVSAISAVGPGVESLALAIEKPIETTALTPVRVAEIAVDQAARDAEAQGLTLSANQTAKPPVISPQETPAESAAGRGGAPGEQAPTSGVVAPEVTAPITPTTIVGEKSQDLILRDLKDIGLTEDNAKSIISGTKSVQEVVESQLGVFKSKTGGLDAETIIVEERPDGGRNIGFSEEAGPASTVPKNAGTMSHSDAVALAKDQAIEDVQKVLLRYGIDVWPERRTQVNVIEEQQPSGGPSAIQESRPGEIPVPESERTQVHPQTGEGVLRDSGLVEAGQETPKTVAEQPAPTETRLVGYRTEGAATRYVTGYPQHGEGTYYAIEKPYQPERGKVTTHELTINPSKIVDPFGFVEGTNKAKSVEDWNASMDALEKASPSEVKSVGGDAEFRKRFLMDRGYNGLAGFTEPLLGKSGGKEIVLWDKPAPAQPPQPDAPPVAPVTPVPVQQQPPAATPAAPAPTPAPVQPQPAPFTPGALKTPPSKRIGIVPGQPLPQIDGLLTKAGDFFKKYFTAKGLKSAAFFDLEKRMQHERTMYGRQVERLNADFKAALRKAYGISRAREAAGAFRLIPESDVQLMDNYLKGNVAGAAAIPVEVRGVLDNMRAVVDGLSTEMANMLRAKAASLPANRVSQRTQLIQLADKILQGRNQYLHRSYAFFDSKLNALDWFQQMPAPIRQAAENYIQANTGTGAPLTLLQSQTKLLDWLEELKPFFGSKGPGTSKLGSKDMSVLMKRGVIAPELRALLGEYRDPLINFTETVAKLSQHVASQKFLNDVRDLGIRDQWLYPEGRQPPGFNVKIAGAESDSMNPLNGMRTSPQIAEIFAEYMKQSKEQNLLIRLYLGANAWTKQAATTMSLMTQMRNLLGQPFFFGMSGHWSIDALGTALRGMREEVFRSGNQNVRAYLDDAARYGIFGDTARSAELDAILKDADFQTVAPEKLSDWSTGRMIKRGINTANKFYRVSDEFGKLVGWEVEKRNVSAVNPTWTPEQVKAEAAKRISNFYPTGSMVPESIKQLRKLPFGPFMTFAFEAVRTSANAITQSVKELRSSNPVERSIGAKRLASQLVTLSIPTAISGATAYLFGVSRQEQDDFRKFQPDYAKNSQYAWMPSKPGERNTVNLSYINPYQYTDVIGSVIRGSRDDKPIVDVIAQATAESLRPFYSESMLTTVVADYMRNKDRYGNEIYNEQDTLDSKAQKTVRHFAMPFLPGSLQRTVKRIIPSFYKEQPPYGRKLEPTREIAREVTGISLDGFDYRVGLGKGARAYITDSNDSKSLFREPLLRNKPLTEDEMFDYYVKSDQARQRNWILLREKYLAALRRGVPIATSIQALKDNGVGEKEAGSIVSGVYIPYEVTDDLYEKALERGKKIPLLRIEDYRKQQIGVRK